MALWRDGVSITVEVAFASTPLATSPSWTDITDYVRDVPSVFRGRTDEYGDFAPGYAVVVLDNRDRRFDPDYAAGAYDPNVLPMRRIKITWAFAAASGLVFTGFVLGWPQSERKPSDGFVAVTAVDGSRFAENSPLASSAYAAEVLADTPVAYIPAQDADVSAMLIETVNGNHLIKTAAGSAVSFDAGFPLGEPLAVQWANNGFVTQYSGDSTGLTPPKSIDLWLNAGDATVSNITANVVGDGGNIRVRISSLGLLLDYSNTSDNRETTSLAVLDLPQAASLGWFHFAARADATNIYSYVNGRLIDTTALSASSTAYTQVLFVSLSDSTAAAVSHIAAYSTDIGATRIQAHYEAGLHAYGHPIGETSGERIGRVLDEVGWPSGLRDIDTGQPPQGPYLPASMPMMEYARKAERSEQGMLFYDVSGQVRFIGREGLWSSTSVATFTDDGNAGDLVYLDAVRGSHHDTIRNIVTASWRLGGITNRDATSITNYGEARESVDSVTLNTAQEAGNLSAYVVRTRKDPSTRISSLTVPVRITGGDNEAEKLLALEIGDRITVERTPMGVSPQVVKDVIVQGLQHEITPSQWIVTVYSSPAPLSNTAAPYLTLGDATYGKVGAADGNLIPF